MSGLTLSPLPLSAAIPVADQIQMLTPGIDVRDLPTLLEHGKGMRALVDQHGALLLRGFRCDSSAALSALADAIHPGMPLDYRGGTSPRTHLDRGVYSSTEYPAALEISLHNEMSYSKRVPDYLLFACLEEPTDRGETPFADCARVLQDIAPEVRERFHAQGLAYVRNLYGPRFPFNSWTKAFETDDSSVVESYCKQFDIDWTWTDDGGLRTVERRPALAAHPRSGIPLWFNQATLWHPSNAPVPVQLTAASRKKLPLYVEFGNGELIDVDDLTQIRAAYGRQKRWFRWQHGDVLILDNWRMTHGRRPFTGKRQIAVAMRGATA